VKNLILSAALAALLLACASAPQRNESVEEARTEVQKLSQQPLAQQAASTDIEAARSSLQQADTALQQRKSPDEVNHLAYLALRHAQAGQARVAAAAARQEVAQAEQERNRVVLQTRERETQRARSEAETAKSQAETAKSQAETAKNEAQAVQSQLESARQQLQDLQAKQTERGMVVTLGDVLFDTGRATLKPGAERALERLAQFLRTNPGTRIIVEGHTDSVGSEAYNEELSQRRAQAVTEALRARGVPAEQYQAKGLGKAYPVASNETPAGRQQNRRVEIVFSDASGRFAEGPSADPIRR
jgi:outer membrane protein OmpA-like peptidoglycan-associated protein